MPEMMKPGEKHESLKKLEGLWSGDEMMKASPMGPGGKTSGRMNFKMDLGGFFLFQDYAQQMGGKTTFEGRGIIGWDKRWNHYCWYWVDAMGVMPITPMRGNWEGNSLVFYEEGARARFTYRIDGRDSLSFTMEGSQDGGRTYAELLEGRYHRVSAPVQREAILAV